ncbi:unnamed protein product [marine sediment metagenome]|uniref:Zinc-ribbon domain-containing protein n=1 Tax=marine sediment metagenome TaxID=412755 RepID=X1FUI7_9ZZZZ
MSTRNVLGYCPSCKQNVLLVREAINWPLAIILLIFTGGIGLIVYGIIYYNKVPSRCIHCHSQIALVSISSVQSSNQIQHISRLGQESDINAVDLVEDNKTLQQNICSFCGEALFNKEAKFCAYCGTKV